MGKKEKNATAAATAAAGGGEGDENNNEKKNQQQQQQQESSGTGEVTVLTPTVNQIAGLRLELIRDQEAVGAVKRLQQLRKEQTQAREKIRSLIDEQQHAKNDASSGNNNNKKSSGTSKELDEIDAEFKKLRDQKDVLNRDMDKLRLEQMSMQREMDQINLLESDYELARTSVKPQRQKMFDLKDRLADLKSKKAEKLGHSDEQIASSGVEPLIGGFPSASAAEEKWQSIANQIEKATKANDPNLVSQLGKTQQQAARAKRDWLAVMTLEDQIETTSKQLAKQSKLVEDSSSKLDHIDSEKSKKRESVKSNKQFGTEFDKIRDQLAKLNKQLDKNRERKRELSKVAQERKSDPAFEERSKQIDAKRKEQDELASELEELRSKVAMKKISYDVELRPDLIGRNGAAVAQMQSDFGVHVDFESNGFAIVVGGESDTDAALAAIKEMCTSLKRSRHKEVISIPKEHVKGIIGQGGSNVTRMQTVSGAHIKIDQTGGSAGSAASTPTALLTGTPEAVATAKKLIEEYFKNNTEVAVPFRKDLLEVVMGRGGSTVRKIEQESGVRRIRVDKENFVVYAYGNEEQCKKAKDAYVAIIKEWSTPPFSMKLDERQIRAVIGKGGETINGIQKSTGASLHAEHPKHGQKFGSLQIRGVKEAIEAAREKVEGLLHCEEVKVPLQNASSALFALLTDPNQAPATTTTSSSEEQQQGEGEGEGDQEEGEEEESNKNNKNNNNNNSNKKKKEQQQRLCVLEGIRASTGVDQVSLIRSENCVVIRAAKKDQVAHARQVLERFLIGNRPETIKVPVGSTVLFFPFVGKSSANSMLDSIVRKVKKEQGGGGEEEEKESNSNGVSTHGIRDQGIVEVSGLDRKLVQLVAAEVRSKLEEMAKESVKVISVNAAAVPAIVGQGGSRIRELQTTHKAEIYIDRVKNQVEIFANSEENLKACAEAVEKLAEKPK